MMGRVLNNILEMIFITDGAIQLRSYPRRHALSLETHLFSQ